MQIVIKIFLKAYSFNIWPFTILLLSFSHYSLLLIFYIFTFYCHSTSWEPIIFSDENKDRTIEYNKKWSLYSFGSTVMWFTGLYGNSIFLHAVHRHTSQYFCKRRSQHQIFACVRNIKCPDVINFTSLLFNPCGKKRKKKHRGSHIIFRTVLVQHESTRIRIVYVNKHW